jgi:flagellar motor switch protein FliN
MLLTVSDIREFLEKSFDVTLKTVETGYGVYLFRKNNFNTHDMGCLFTIEAKVLDCEGMINIFADPSFIQEIELKKRTPVVPVKTLRELDDDLELSLVARIEGIIFPLHAVKNFSVGRTLTYDVSKISMTVGDSRVFRAKMLKPSGNHRVEVIEKTKETLGMSKNSDMVNSLDDIDITISVELGRKSVKLRELKEIGEGTLIELDKISGEPVDVFANNALVAKGEVCVTSDDMMSVRIIDIVNGNFLND